VHRLLEPPSVHLRVRFTERPEKAAVAAPEWVPRTTTVDLTQAIYDFNLAYEIAVVRTAEQYAHYDLSNFFLLGRRRPVRRGHQLLVERVFYESPLHFLGLIPPEVLWPGGATTALVFLGKLFDVVETAYTIPLNFKNARLRSQIENARLQMERDDVQRQAAARLANRVKTERLQLTHAEIESDDWPRGLA
jgi:hypothetical protein